MSLDLEFGTAFQSTPEIRHEKRRADVILSKNNDFETLRNKEITIMFDTGNFVNLEIDGMSYQVIKKVGSKLFHTRPKYTTQESFMLPLILGLLGFSTFYNVQFYFQVEQVVTLSNTYLFLLFIGASIGWGIERNLSKSELIFLKQEYKTLVPIDLGNPLMPDMVRHYYQHRGYSLSQIFGAVAVGITLLAPIALSDIAYQIDYFVSWLAAAIAFSVVMNKSIFTKESEEKLRDNTPLIYAPHAVEAIFEEKQDNEQFIGFRRLGLLLDIKGNSKEERKKSIAKIESHYKNKRVVGFSEVIETENALETPEQTFQGYISEAYRDENKNVPEFRELEVEEIRAVLDRNIHELTNGKLITKKDKEMNEYISNMAQGLLNYYNTLKDNETGEINFAIKNIDDVKAALEKSIKDLAPTKRLQSLLLDIPEINFAHKATKDILLYYDRLVRLLQNAIAYLAQENKNRESISISDKTLIKHLRAAYHSVIANLSKPPKVEAAIDRSGLYKTTIISIASVIMLFIFVWAIEKGVF